MGGRAEGQIGRSNDPIMILIILASNCTGDQQFGQETGIFSFSLNEIKDMYKIKFYSKFQVFKIHVTQVMGEL